MSISTSAQWRRFPFISKTEVGGTGTGSEAGEAASADKGKQVVGASNSTSAPSTSQQPILPSDLSWLASDDSAEITCAAPGRRFAYLGDLLGRVHVVDAKLELVDSFEAHEPPIPAPPPPIPGTRRNDAGNASGRVGPRRTMTSSSATFERFSVRSAAAQAGIRLVGVTHIVWNAEKNILLTAGEDKDSMPRVRLWNLDKMDMATGRPQLLREIKASSDARPIPITSIALLPALTHLAIGLENGSVMLIKGDLARAERSTKSRIMYEGESTVTGLLFAERGNRLELVVVNRDRVVRMGVSSSDSKKKDHVDILDSSIGTSHPSLLLQLPSSLTSHNTPQSTELQFLLARPEAVYQFSSESGRQNAWFISESADALGSGEKDKLGWYRGYFALVTKYPVLGPPKDDVPGSPRSPRVITTMEDNERAVTVLTLYDLRNKFVSFSGIFTRDGIVEDDGIDVLSPSKEVQEKSVGVGAIWSQWGFLWVITEDHRVFRFAEKDLSTRLELLFKRNMYSLALSLVQSEQQAAQLGLPGSDRSILDAERSPYEYDTVTEIHKRYGDWLYSKGDHEAAVNEYCSTIPFLESSYVIRRYLDVQKMELLARYLEALHDKGAATPDHTTLLLNCYAKARDSAKLDAFLAAGKELQFDVDTAVTVCRSAGYHVQALDLAKRYSHHDSVMRIMVDDLRNYKDAVDYLSGLPFREAAGLAARYGSVLVDQVPEEATEVLTRLCTGWYPVVRHRKLPEVAIQAPQENEKPRSALATGLGISSPSSAGKRTPGSSSRPSTPSFAQEEIGKAAAAAASGLKQGLDRIVGALPVPGSRPRTPTRLGSPAAALSSSVPAAKASSWSAAGGEGDDRDREALFSRRDTPRSGGFVPPSTASLPRANAAEFVQLFAGQSKVPAPVPTGEEGRSSAASAPPPILTAEQVAKRDELKTKFCIAFLEQVLEKRGKGKLYSAAEVERSLTSQGGVQMVGLDEAETGLVLDDANTSGGSPLEGNASEVESKVLWNTLLELYLGGTIVGTLIPGRGPTPRAETPFGTPLERGLTPGSVPERRRALSVDGDTGSMVSAGSRPRSPSVVEDWKNKAMGLLRNSNANYDPDHALVLCQSRGFSEGVLYLTEKLSLFNDLMRLQMESKNYSAVVGICLGHGKDHPALWHEALAFFAAQAEDSRAQSELHRLLQEIDKRKLMPLLQVLQILSGAGSTVTVGLVKDYILKHVRKQKEQMDEDRKLTKEYQEETKRMREEMDDLLNNPILFETTICSSCNQPLDLPTIHYYCKHAYHERCLPLASDDSGSSHPECPKCEPNNRMILEMIRSQEARAADPEVFKRAMQRNATGDRWDVVAEWYGRNVFWTPRQTGAGMLGGSANVQGRR